MSYNIHEYIPPSHGPRNPMNDKKVTYFTLILIYMYTKNMKTDGVLCHFQQYFSYNVAVSFIGGGNWSTQRKLPMCRKSLTNFII